jgi:hypothetical protein
MATNELQHVSPGQLITTAWANGIVDEINSLQAQLDALGSPPSSPPAAGAPLLTSRSPAGNIQVNGLLTLLGQNFSPLSQARVNFGSLNVTQFLSGSSDTQINVSVPNIPLGPVGLSVSTPQGTSNVLAATVVAAPPPQGGNVHIDVANDPSNPPNPTANTPLQLQWSVASDTINPDTYTFAVEFSDITPAATPWSASLNVSEKQVTPGSPFTVVATVQVPSTGSATVVLTATSTTDSTRNTTSSPLILTVGVSTPTSDPRIALRVSNPQPDNDPDGNPSNAALIFEGGLPVILVSKSSDSFVQIEVHFSDTLAAPPVNYRFFADVDDTTHWATKTASPPTLVQSLLGGTTTVLYNLTNKATNSAANDTQLTVSAAKLKGDGTDDYVSFAPVTLRNAG